MDTRTLVGTDLRVTRACFGTMTFGQQADETTARQLVDCCFDAGINFFDTANIYSQGRSEEILGKVLKGRRHQVILASKVRSRMGDGPEECGLSRPAILRAIDETLRRLDTDYLDIYYLHQPDYDVPVEETLEAMEELVRSGRVRFAGISNYASWQACQIVSIARAKGYCPATVAQPMYNLLARGIEQEFVPMARELGVSLVVYNPLAGGLLTGKQPRHAPLPGTRFNINQAYLERYWHPAFFDAVDRLKAIAGNAQRSLVDLSLSWILHHTQADCVLLGASSLIQLQENLSAVNSGPLCPDTLSACNEVWQELRGVTPQYNR